MVRLTIQCGMDSTTFPIYINGTWIRNISLSFIPEFYKYEIPDDTQSSWFTTEIKTHLTHGSQGLSVDRDHPHLPAGFTALGSVVVAPHLSAYVSIMQVRPAPPPFFLTILTRALIITEIRNGREISGGPGKPAVLQRPRLKCSLQLPAATLG